MSARLPLRSALACSLLLGLVACGGGGPELPEEKPPNVILISLDTLRAGHMSVYGYERETTPNLARFAEGATVYERAIASSCWTLISHVSMLTGLYPEQHGVVNASLALGDETPTLAGELYDAGYQTLAIYKEGWISERFGVDCGFEVFRDHEDAFEAGPNLAEELDKIKPNRPFFLFLHLFDIHSTKIVKADDPFYDPPAPWDEMFVEDARARLDGIDFTVTRSLDPDKLEALIGTYDGGIAWIDDLLGQWFADWERRGLMENTMVVITADHGEALGQRGYVKGHGAMWQDGLHVPLIVRYPDGRLAGERVERVAAHVDIAPTILDAVGLEIGAHLPGYSLLGEWPEDRVVRAAKPPHFARVRWPMKMIGGTSSRKFFDLVADPLETDELKGNKRQNEADLDAAFEAEFAERGWAHFNTKLAGMSDRKILRDLRALGYAGELGDEDEDPEVPEDE